MDYRWDDTVASSLQDDLDRLVYLSKLVGADPGLAQAGGGNTSYKCLEKDHAGREIETLWVKSTGADLRDIDRRGFTALRLSELRLLRHRPAMSDEEMMAFMASSMMDVRHPLPSIETLIHVIPPARWIVHTHDVAVPALTDTSKKDAFVREALGDEIAYVGYTRSGFPLAKAIMALNDFDKVKGLVVGKHGLVAWGESAKECYDNLHRLISRGEEYLKRKRTTKDPMAKRRHGPTEPAAREAAARALLPVLRGMLSHTRKTILHLDDSYDSLRYVDSEMAKQIHRRGMATPEHILRCGRQPMYVDAEVAAMPTAEAAAVLRQAVDTFENDYRASFAKHGKGTEMLGPGPRIVLLPGVGIVAAGRDARTAAIAAECYREVIRVMEIVESYDQFRFLEEASAFEFEYWPLELQKQRQAEPDLARRVAVITGGASGMGRAIAERFATEGCHVVITDLDGEGARRAAEAVAQKVNDPHRALGIRADATSESETAAAFAHAVRVFGGVDILVCNAGIVQTAPVEKITEESWDRHFDVNVKGYFLAAREAIRIMKAQGWGSIVFNASKAAFAATTENAAYATSKAAVAALARNLAVELAPAQIRVNYFNADFVDTPMMRKMIQDRAAAKGITTEQQVEDYRKRNLLNVGPIPAEAVAEAALFLASDRSRYTTGSVITVDGGLRDAMPR
ncbi:MAG TPA: bifunctional rhamnulose-1-phosphate aldolase/short-chain dehydrogenase [Planctomycetota bacterium]|nr:bifunctional rhamnulose-1-phosphate aldolase/short-chain dehydrogenase [Planctomycetota bacterium]